MVNSPDLLIAQARADPLSRRRGANTPGWVPLLSVAQARPALWLLQRLQLLSDKPRTVFQSLKRDRLFGYEQTLANYLEHGFFNRSSATGSLATPCFSAKGEEHYFQWFKRDLISDYTSPLPPCS